MQASVVTSQSHSVALEKRREREKSVRASETAEEKEIRRMKRREREKKQRATETEEQSIARRTIRREIERKRRMAKTEQERNIANQHRRELHALKRREGMSSAIEEITRSTSVPSVANSLTSNTPSNSLVPVAAAKSAAADIAEVTVPAIDSSDSE